MRCWLLIGASSTCLACSSAAPPRPAAPTSSTVPTSAKATSAAPPAPRNAPAPAHLRREFTGQKQPSLLVENLVGSRQHVFIDWTARTELAPGAAERFELAPGPHTVTCSDSPDPDDDPASVTETFETGFSYA